MARLAHPNVVGVFDQGARASTSTSRWSTSPGCTLRDVLRERGALQPRAALDILEPVLAALGAAHRAGFVHRDMKPENVLIGDDGRVKVADFGLVRAVDSVTSTTGPGPRHRLLPRPRADRARHRRHPRRRVRVRCRPVRDAHRRQAARRGHPRPDPLRRTSTRACPRRPPPCPGSPSSWTSWSPRRPPATPTSARTTRWPCSRRPVRPARPSTTSSWTRCRRARARTAPGPGSEDRTSVIPRALTTPRDPAAVPLPAEPPRRVRQPHQPADHAAARRGASRSRRRARRRGRARHRRGLIAVVAALLLVLGVGAGVWYINSGQFTRVPALIGQSEDAAKKKLSDAGLDVKKVDTAVQRHRRARPGHRRPTRPPAPASAATAR